MLLKTHNDLESNRFWDKLYIKNLESQIKELTERLIFKTYVIELKNQ